MIFNMSLQASIFIIVIIIMRKLLKNKVPKKTFLVLWLIAWVKLMIPYSWSSKWSIMNLVSLYQKSIKSAYINIIELIRKAAITPITIESDYEPIIKSVKKFNIKALKVYREALPVNTQFFIQWKEKHYLDRNYRIKELERISSPLTYGFINPVILIPKSILAAEIENMEYILLHEWNHIRRWDTLKKWLLVMILCIHWFNPLVWVMFMLVNRDIELCCDEDLVCMIGENNKKKYANLLINMEEKRIKLNPLCLGFGNNYMKERIVSIMEIKKASTSMILLATILVIGATTVFATSGLEKPNNGLTKKPLVVGEVNSYNESMTEENYIVDISDYDLHGKTYEEADLILKELGLSFVIEK